MADGRLLPIAQTNVQLLGQLRSGGWGETDLARVRDAYEAAMTLFTGCFRQSGKTFLAHLVGTASILAHLDQRSSVVAAGLLHAAYTHGDFGYGGRAVVASKRRRLSRAVGDDVEALVAAYAAFPWHSHLCDVLARLDAFDTHTREVVVMRLANELEDHLDLVALYAGDAERRRGDARRDGPVIVEMARRLGMDALASALEAAFAETVQHAVPASCRLGNRFLEGARPIRHAGPHSSFVLPPLSHRARLARALRLRLRDFAWARALYRATRSR